MKQLGIIVVTYCSERHVAPLLRSLAATLDLARSVIWVLDNASPDATVAALERENAALRLPLHLIRSEINHGFPEGNNIAYAALCAETPCENIVLLNPDTMVHPGWWQPLLAALTEPAVGSVMPLLLLPDGTINSRGNALHFLGLGFVQGYGEAITGQVEPSPFFSSSGAAVAFRAATLEALNSQLGTSGIFWSELFLYAEDTDLGWRLRLCGLDHRLVPASRVTHDHRFWLETSGGAGERLFLIERNRFLLMLANFKWATLLLLLPWLAASEIALGLGLWKLYPYRLRLWGAVWAETQRPGFWARRRRIQNGRTARDRAILRAMTGSIRHGALPFHGRDFLMEASLRGGLRLLCLLVWW